MKAIFFITGVVLFHTAGMAQIPDDLGINAPWVPTSLVLTNGEKYNQGAQHNEYLGTISILSADGDSVTMSEDRVERMTYRDPSTGVIRRFQRFEFYSELTTKRYGLLFEILKEFPTFAVLSRTLIASAVARVPDNEFSYGASPKLKPAIGAGALLLFLDENNKMETYLKEIDMKWNGLFKDRSKSKTFYYRGILKKYLDEHYDAVVQYAKKNKIKLKTREGVLEALEYYQTLLK